MRTEGFASITCRITATKVSPIVVFSILAAEARAKEAGASAFLRKPLIGETFVAVIRQVIDAQPSVRME